MGNLQENSTSECSRRFQGMFEKIQGNGRNDSGECLRIFWRISKIPGNAQKDSREYSKRFWRMFKKIPENVKEYSRECSRVFRRMLSILN